MGLDNELKQLSKLQSEYDELKLDMEVKAQFFKKKQEELSNLASIIDKKLLKFQLKYLQFKKGQTINYVDLLIRMREVSLGDSGD